MEKNNKGVIFLLLIIIVILSVLCVLFATGTITLNTGDKNNNGNQNIVESNDGSQDDNLPEWVSYLLKQNITEVTYESGNLEYDKENDVEVCEPAKIMTKEQLRNVLIEMTEGKLKKYDAGGFGGPCEVGITVKYNNQKLFINGSNKIIVDEDLDSNIVTLLEKEQYELNNKTYGDDPLWTFEYDWDESYLDTLFK